MERPLVPIADPEPAVVGWLLVLCLLLTFVHPGGVFYHVVAYTLPALFKAHDVKAAALMSVYVALFLGIAGYSVVAGARLWLVKPQAVRFARRYLLVFLCAHLGYFSLWAVVVRPTHLSTSLAVMISNHVAGPVPFYFLWTVYLEHSKRVRATYDPEAN